MGEIIFIGKVKLLNYFDHIEYFFSMISMLSMLFCILMKIFTDEKFGWIIPFIHSTSMELSVDRQIQTLVFLEILSAAVSERDNEQCELGCN